MAQLAPELEQWLAQFYKAAKRALAQGWQPNPENMRQSLASLTQQHVTQAVPMAWVQDASIQTLSHTIPLRIYDPAPDQALPVMVYLHGGGHMAGSIEVYDPICRRLAQHAHCIVVAVDYRLAPEYPYPAGLEDARHVLEQLWICLSQYCVHFEKTLFVAGDSAGGALTASLAHYYQGHSEVEIAAQVLIYPSLDYTKNPDHISMQSRGMGYLLHADKIAWYFDHYFPASTDRKAASPLWMPIYADMPRTLVITAEFDPLCDEGLAYLNKLNQAGVKTEALHHVNMIHAFLNLEDLAKAACEQAYQRIARFLQPLT